MKTKKEPFEMESFELEQAVLCTLLSCPQTIPDVISWLRVEMFESPDIQFVYAALTAQYNRGEKPDYFTTEMEMKRTDYDRYKQISGLGCLGHSWRKARGTENLVLYAEEIRRCFTLRKLQALFTLAAGKAGQQETMPVDLMLEVERELMEVRKQTGHDSQLKPFGILAEKIWQHHRKNSLKKVSERAVFTGLTEFDLLFGGFQPGELYVEGGRPGDGKTAIALHIALQAALKEKVTSMFCLEMSDLQTLNRVFVGHAGIPNMKLRLSNLTEEEFDRMHKLVQAWENLPLYLDFTPDNTVENIRAQVLLMNQVRKCDLVIVDYLHLLRSKPRKGETMEQIVGRNATALKNLAMEANCPVLLLSQLNRQSEYRPEKGFLPNLADLRDSGVIEQVADGAFFIHRPERHGITRDEKTGEDLTGVSFLIVRKNRNGITGTARIRHNDSLTRFRNLDDEEDCDGCQ